MRIPARIKLQFLILPLAFWVGVFVFASGVLATVGVNRQINFQGKVVNKVAGTNVANGNYDFTFKLYNVSSGGSAIWTETRTGGNQVAVTDGIFQVSLGSVTTFASAAVDFTNDSLYLDVTFNGETMGTRIRLSSAAYALFAEQTQGLSIASGKTVTFADNFTTSGAFATTLTSTAITNATLPAGTVTLVDLATSQSLTNKTIGSTGLVFSGATTDIDTAAAEGLTLQGRAASAFNTTSGNLSFQAAGTGTIATVQIGAGGSGSTTPDFLGLDVKSDTGDPAGGFEGAIYYNTFDNKFRCYQNTGWTDCIGTGGTSAFSGLTGGTNTTAAMVVGSGATLDYTGTGTINSSSLIGGTWAIPGAIGATTANTGAFTTLTASSTITQTFAGTTTSGTTINANSLSSGTGLVVSSTSTGLTTGQLASIDWSPGSATTSTGDLLSVNVGANGIVGNIFNVKDGGSSVLGVSQSAITASLPVSFNAVGDVGIAYDLNFTNSTAANIKSSAPLYITAGEVFNSSDLILRTYNNGNVIVDSHLFVSNPTVTGKALAILNQTESQDIFAASASGVTKLRLTNAGALVISGGAGDPTATTGTVWYDTTANKFKIVENSVVKTLCNTTDAGCGAGGSGARLDQVTAATTTSTTANANNAIVWNWGTLTTQTGMVFGGGTAMTTGSVFTLGATSNVPTYVHTAAESGYVANIKVNDSSTNATGNSVTYGINIDSEINTSGAGTKDVGGVKVSAPTLTACTTGNCTWDGIEVNTQATGALSTITQNGLSIAAAGVSAGSLNGIKIGDITAGAGTEYAISIGSGWDEGIMYNSTTGNLTFGTINNAGGAAAGIDLEVGTSSSGAPAITIGTSTNSLGKTITIGTSGAGTGTITIDQGTGAHTFNLGTGVGTGAKTINIGSGGQQSAVENIFIGNSPNTGNATATRIFIGNASNNARTVFFDHTATPQIFDTNGQFALGRVGTAATSGRLWVRSSGTNFRFNSVVATADYSEYLQQEDTSEPGDVMVFSSSNEDTVKRGNKKYDAQVLGVVTTSGTGNNNQSEGDCDKVDVEAELCGREVNPKFANVGMLGHVYTKVTNENGNIVPGDPLTSSGQIGKAMKATKAGRIIGYALESYDGNPKGARPSWFNWPRPSQHTIVSLIQPGWFDPATPVPDSVNQAIIANLGNNTFGLTDSTGRSWDNLIMAENAAIGNLKVGGLDVKSLKINGVDGLDVYASKDYLNGKISGIESQISSLISLMSTSSANISLSADRVTGLENYLFGASESGLLKNNRDTAFGGFVEFLSKVFLKGEINLEGQVVFNKDTAGVAVIPEVAKSVDVTFEREYANPPIVNISLRLTEASESGKIADDIKAAVTGISTKGFSIVMDQYTDHQIEFNWMAIGVKDVTRQIGKSLIPEASDSGVIIDMNPEAGSASGQVVNSP